MKRVPYKFEVVSVCQVLGENDEILSEQSIGFQAAAGAPPQPVTVFGVEGLVKFAEGFEAQLDGINKQGPPGGGE